MIKVLNLIPSGGDGTGWSVCGRYLSRYLPNHCEVVTPAVYKPEDGGILLPRRSDELNYENAFRECDVVLAPVGNLHWSYISGNYGFLEEARSSGKKIVGYAFHEFNIAGTQDIECLHKNWDGLACGSTWMADWVSKALDKRELDMPVGVAIQGVDTELFHYREPERPEWMQGRFVIASCGKFEYRKSQDVVIEAFRRFKKYVPEAMLMMAWHNPWPETMRSMAASKWEHNLELQGDSNGNITILGVDRKLIDPKDQISWMPTGVDGMPQFYQNADIALFPNRCEAGQSLPAVEAIASGIPSILVDGHGMRDLVDIVEESPCTFLEGGKTFNYEGVANWIEPCMDEVLSEMRRLYKENHNKESRVFLSNLANKLRWDDTAKSLVNLCESVVR